MFSMRSKSRNVKDADATLKSFGSKGSDKAKNSNDDEDELAIEKTTAGLAVRPKLTRSYANYGITPRVEDPDLDDEISKLNVISIESTIENSSPIEQERTASTSSQDQQWISEDPGSYSVFHDNGEEIENPTSYILETDSDDDTYSLPTNRGPMSGNIISFGSGPKIGREVYQEGVDTKSSEISAYGPNRANRGASSVYSSQETVRLSIGSGIQTPIVHTPKKFLDPEKVALNSAPLPLTTRRLGSSRAPEAFFSTSADINEAYHNDPTDGLEYDLPSASIPQLLSSALPKTSPSFLDLGEHMGQVESSAVKEKCATEMPPDGKRYQEESQKQVQGELQKQGKGQGQVLHQESFQAQDRKQQKDQNKQKAIEQREEPGPQHQYQPYQPCQLDYAEPTTENAQQDNISGWNSAIPALIYSNNMQTGNGDTAEFANSSIQGLQETLLRGEGSLQCTKQLEAIKRSLSRTKSKSNTGPNNDPNKGDSPPLLFSQDRNSISRSMSICRDKQKGKDPQEVLNGQPQVREDKLEPNDEVSIIETLRDGNDEYNVATRETELNCEKKDSRFFQAARDIPSMFKDENIPDYDDDLYDSAEKGQNKEKTQSNNLHQRGKDGKDDKENTWEARFRKPVSDKVYSLIIWILIMIILLMICTLVPLLILYSRGTESIVVNYLNNINPLRRSELLQKFFPLGNSTVSTPAYQNNTVTSYPLIGSNSSLPNNGSSKGSVSIAGISKFERIPKKYQRNEEIQEMMNNTALKNVFYGIDYAPRNVIYPICGATLHEVMLDVAQLSQVTSRLRTYGTQCNQAKFILDSVKTLNLNVSLSMGVWIGPNDDINQLQIEDMKSLLREYPRKYFDAVFMGNEVLFREEQSPNKLIEYINDAKEFIKNELEWDLPVGTSEVGPKPNFDVMAASDIYGFNSHPFFTGKVVQLASKWVFDFVKYRIEPMVKSKVQIIISEIGWPYHGGKYKKAVAGKRHMQYFLDSWICEAKERSYPWYFFEAYDEPWKQIYHSQNSEWETEWGLFTADRKLKEGITIPSC